MAKIKARKNGEGPLARHEERGGHPRKEQTCQVYEKSANSKTTKRLAGSGTRTRLLLAYPGYALSGYECGASWRS